MALPRPSRPAALWRDLLAFLGTRQRHRVLFAAISIAIPALLIAGFYVDSKVEPVPLGTIYVESWPADRSDDEIVAQQKIDQAKRENAMAAKRAEYQRLKERLGI